jgi:hypothetical protein
LIKFEEWLENFKKDGLVPTSLTYNAIIRYYPFPTIEMVEDVIEEMKKNKMPVTPLNYIDAAERLIKNGHISKGIQFIQNMKTSFDASHSPFVARFYCKAIQLLVNYCHRFDLAFELFEEVYKQKASLTTRNARSIIRDIFSHLPSDFLPQDTRSKQCLTMLKNQSNDVLLLADDLNTFRNIMSHVIKKFKSLDQKTKEQINQIQPKKSSSELDFKEGEDEEEENEFDNENDNKSDAL